MDYKVKNYINGELVDAGSGSVIEGINPATNKKIYELPDSDENDVDKAVNAASLAYLEWANMPQAERTACLLKLSKLVEENQEDLAQLESLDTGKPISLARRMDIPRAAANLSFFATAATHFSSESHITSKNTLNYTLRQPLGVVGCISPWNLPLYLFTWKIAPALAVGNTVIAKPSELSALTAYKLSQLANAAGLPNGVLNIVHGYGGKAGAAISKHPDVKAISFTGGTATGAEIARVAAPSFKKLSLELGGKNPAIIFLDCDYDKMLETVVRSSFTNQGQICLCTSRILIERKLYDRFKEDFVKRVSKLRIGDPLDMNTEFGAVISQQHKEKIKNYINLAQQEGGNILCGGFELSLAGELSTGNFIQPTVVEGLSQMCQTNQEEIFGPVVTIQAFDFEEEAIVYANSVRYGLSATVWTENISRAQRITNALEAGVIWVNCWLLRDLRTPFGGMKNSGVGREGGLEALRFFTDPKNVCIQH